MHAGRQYQPCMIILHFSECIAKIDNLYIDTSSDKLYIDAFLYTHAHHHLEVYAQICVHSTAMHAYRYLYTMHTVGQPVFQGYKILRIVKNL